MLWYEWEDDAHECSGRGTEQEDYSHLNFDFSSLLSKPKDYYRILEVDYDATEDAIRSNYIRLALKWHPDKKNGGDGATSMFQEINEAYHGQSFGESLLGILVGHYGLLLLSVIILCFKCVRLHIVLSDPVKRREYDKKGMLYAYDYNIIEYLDRYKGLILTCNGLGMKHYIW